MNYAETTRKQLTTSKLQTRLLHQCRNSMLSVLSLSGRCLCAVEGSLQIEYTNIIITDGLTFVTALHIRLTELVRVTLVAVS